MGQWSADHFRGPIYCVRQSSSPRCQCSSKYREFSLRKLSWIFDYLLLSWWEKTIHSWVIYTDFVAKKRYFVSSDRFCCSMLKKLRETLTDAVSWVFDDPWAARFVKRAHVEEKKFQSRFLGERIAVLWPDLIRIKFSFEKRHSRESCLSWDGCSTNNWHERGSEHEITELVH